MVARFIICTVGLTLVALSQPVQAGPSGPGDDLAGAQARTTAKTSPPVRVAQRTPGNTSATGFAKDVANARAELSALKSKKSRLRASKAGLVKQYQKQLADIDRLKKQRASWRRDRQIRSRMRESHGTAKQLSALEQRLRRLGATIRKRERALVAAIDHELRSAPTAARARQLRTWRRAAGKGLRRNARKIVLPEDDIDPLADPEELEYQASLLRQSEEQLEKELDKLDHQAKRYQHMVSLRKKFRRADELARFDDDRPRRGSGRAGSRADTTGVEAGENSTPTPPPPSQLPPPPEADPGPNTDLPPDNNGGDPPNGGDTDLVSISDSMFDVVLADVVDASTIKALRAAGVSSDPALKARAAEQARKQVRARVERLRQRRKLMQKRAKRLRNRP